MRPLMVNSEQVVRKNFGNEQYAKAATALNILRETIMGPELFDKAFKEYASRWAFKHPHARRSLPHTGGCICCGSRLVLEGLVLHYRCERT